MGTREQDQVGDDSAIAIEDARRSVWKLVSQWMMILTIGATTTRPGWRIRVPLKVLDSVAMILNREM